MIGICIHSMCTYQNKTKINQLCKPEYSRYTPACFSQLNHNQFTVNAHSVVKKTVTDTFSTVLKCQTATMWLPIANLKAVT